MQMQFLIAIAAAACILGMEIFGIGVLLRRIFRARREEKEQPSNHCQGAFLGLFAGTVIPREELVLSVLVGLALAGAFAFLFLLVYSRTKGYDGANKGNSSSVAVQDVKTQAMTEQKVPNRQETPLPAQKPSAFSSWENTPDEEDEKQPAEWVEPEEEGVLAAFATVAEKEAEVPPKNQSKIPPLPPKPKRIPPIPLPKDEEDDDSDVDEDDPDEPIFEDPGDDPNVFMGDERIIGFNEETGCYIVAHYRKSFEAKLVQARPNIKHYYSELKNALLSYEGTKSRLSWTADSFHNGRNAIAKMNAKTRVLELYLALDPKSLEGTVYRGKDVSKMKKYADTPFQYKIRTPRKFNWAMELVRRTCEEHNLTPVERIPEDYERIYTFDTIENLVTRGLVKEYIREEKREIEALSQTERMEEVTLGEEREYLAEDAAWENAEPMKEVSEEFTPEVEPVQAATEKEFDESVPDLPAPEQPLQMEPERVIVPPKTLTLNWDIPMAPETHIPVKEEQENPLFADEELKAFRTQFEEKNINFEDVEEKTEVRQPKGDKPNVGQPKVEEPTVEQPRIEEPNVGQPRVEEPTKESVIVPKSIRILTEEPASQVQPHGEDSVPAFASQTRTEREPLEKKTLRVSDPSVAVVDVKGVESDFSHGATINLRTLKEKGLILPTAVRLKIYTTGNLSKPFTVEANKFTMEAILAIHAAGGETVVVL